MEIIYTDGRDERFIRLCNELDGFLNASIGIEKQQKQYNEFNTLADINDVVIIMKDGQEVACGSFKKYEQFSMHGKEFGIKIIF